MISMRMMVTMGTMMMTYDDDGDGDSNPQTLHDDIVTRNDHDAQNCRICQCSKSVRVSV